MRILFNYLYASWFSPFGAAKGAFKLFFYETENAKTNAPLFNHKLIQFFKRKYCGFQM